MYDLVNVRCTLRPFYWANRSIKCPRISVRPSFCVNNLVLLLRVGPLQGNMQFMISPSNFKCMYVVVYIQRDPSLTLTDEIYSFKVKCKCPFRSIVGNLLTITFFNFSCIYALMNTIHCDPLFLTLIFNISSSKVKCKFAFRPIKGTLLTATLSNFTCIYALMITIHCDLALTLTFNISIFKVNANLRLCL